MRLTYFTLSARDARRLCVILLAVALAGLAASSAGANSSRSTKGDAEAVLNAFGNGGWAVLLHSATSMGAPAAGLVGSATAIRPFPEFFEGQHYCVLDWHVALIAWGDGGDKSFTRAEAEAYLRTVVNTFWIDGATVATERRPVQPFLNPARFGLAEVYAFPEGVLLSPSDLEVGAHTLRVQTRDSSGVFFDEQITFYIDAAGTGVCL